MSIKADVEELRKIDVDIKRTLESLKKLRAAKKILEERVMLYLKEKELPGVKHQNTIIRIDTKTKPVLKSKSSRESAIYGLLLDAGVKNPNEFLVKMKEAEKDTRKTEKLTMTT